VANAHRLRDCGDVGDELPRNVGDLHIEVGGGVHVADEGVGVWVHRVARRAAEKGAIARLEEDGGKVALAWMGTRKQIETKIEDLELCKT
jgi:hypothetical protein